MPLSLSELSEINQVLHRLLSPGARTQSSAAALMSQEDREVEVFVPAWAERIPAILDQVEKLLTRLNEAIDREIAKAPASDGAEAAPPSKRGRKSAASTTAPTNGSASPAEPAQSSASASPVPPPEQSPATAAPAPDPAMPDFLQRTGTPPAKLGVGVPPEQPAQAPLTEEDVRAQLRAYLTKYGDAGVDKLTVLMAEYGAKEFAQLKKEHWGAVVARVKGEMIL